MADNLETIRASVQGLFSAGWVTRTPIQWEQVTYEPTPGTAYVSVWLSPSDAIQVGLGSIKPFRVFGTVQIDINCPVNTGIVAITGHADKVKDIFLGKQTTAGVTFTNMKIYKTIVGVWQRWCVSFNFYKDILA